MRSRWVLLLAAWLAVPTIAQAAVDPASTRKDREAAVQQAWDQIWTDAQASGAVKRNEALKPEVYAALVDRLLKTEAARAYLELTEADRRAYLFPAGLQVELGAAAAGNAPALARSPEAVATNPRGVALVERSGIVDMISAALQGSNIVSADDTAVTVNLSAAALLCRVCRSNAAPAATRYRAAGWLTRVGGTLTFGAKLTEKEITGFTGLPDTKELFDVVVWNVKVRLIGDRDPRSQQWDRFTLGELGGLDSLRTIAAGRVFLPSDAPDNLKTMSPEELEQAAAFLKARAIGIADAFTPTVHAATLNATRTIQKSLQVSVLFSGQHLTKQAGMNKYTGVFLLDKGFGSFDGTLNVSYSSVQDVKIKPDMPVTLKTWRASAALVGPIWKNLFVPNRSAELKFSGEGLIPADGPEVPVERKTTYKADFALKVPISETLELPFSVTYTNDPNELSKKNYVTGRLGVTYDFGALKRLAQGK